MRQQVLGIDYGQRKMGVAIADLSAHVATPLCVLEGSKQQFVDQLVAIAKLQNIARIVVGMPYRRDGQPAMLAEEIQKFVMSLREQLTIPVVLQDERFTTQVAKRQLRAAKKSTKADDALAAAQILQTYLDRLAVSIFL